jgi:hypothetical protein
VRIGAFFEKGLLSQRFWYDSPGRLGRCGFRCVETSFVQIDDDEDQPNSSITVILLKGFRNLRKAGRPACLRDGLFFDLHFAVTEKSLKKSNT